MIRSLIMMLFLCAAVNQTGSAQASLLNFEHIIPENGLPDKYVNRTLLDHRGFLWIATKNGLCRYDGRRTEALSYSIDNVKYTGGNVTALTQDQNGFIWVVWENHLIRIHSITLATAVLDPSFDGVEDPYYGQLLYSRKTGLWCGGDRFTQIQTDELGQILHIEYYNDTIQEVHNITEFPDGRLAFACEREGTFILDPITRKLNHHKLVVPNALPMEFNNHRCLLVDHNNDLWIGNYHRAFFRLNKDGTFDHFEFQKPIAGELSAYNNMVRSIVEIQNSNGEYELLLGTYDSGLVRFNPEKNTYTFHKNDINIASSLCFNNIRHIHKDRNEKLWIATANGLDQVDFNEQKFTYIRFPYQTSNTIDNWCVSVIPDQDFEKNGTLWAGTFGGALFRINSFTGQAFTEMNLHDQGLSVLSQYIESPYKHHIAGLDRYVIYNQKKGKIVYQEKFNNIGEFGNLELNQIHGMVHTPDSILFIGNPVGVFSIQKKTNEVIHYPEFGSVAFDYFIDQQGRIWVGQQNRITIFNPRSNHYQHLTAESQNCPALGDYVFGMSYDEKRKCVWACTPSGLSRIDVTTFETQHLTQFPKQNYFDVQVDINGNVWFYSLNGLTGYQPETGNAVFYRNQDMMYASPGDYAKIIPLPDGRMVLTTIGGICIVNASDLITNREIELPVEFTYVYNQFSPIDFSQPISIDYFNNSIRLTFACVNFSQNNNIHFEYSLGDGSGLWQNIGNSGEMTFSNLPHDNYQFNVRAVTNDGRIVGKASTLYFSILPAYYQTWWFRIAAILLITAILFGIYKYRIRQLTKLQMVRDNISRDLHDDIGATLSSINITSSLIQRKTKDHPDMDHLLGGMRNDIKHASEALDDIVWSIQPKNDTWPILLSRMRRYASQILENSQIAYTIDFPELDSQQRMKIEQRRDVYLIFKEIVNNAAKHSGAQTVTIRFRLHSENLELEIGDDGKGFDPEASSHRNGLVNLKARVDRWKGQLIFQSAFSQGTRVTVFMPRA
ncbi:MAG: sensor histidine kinase [Flavobacteriales bacterium]